MILSARSAGGAPNRLLWVRSARAAVVCAGLVCRWPEVIAWAQEPVTFLQFWQPWGVGVELDCVASARCAKAFLIAWLGPAGDG